MSKPKTAYSLQIALAMMSQNSRKVYEVTTNVIEKLSNDVSEFAQSYAQSDLPLVLAAMQIVVNGVMPMLGESGQSIVREIVNNTQVTAMDTETFKKLMEEEDD